MRFIVLAAVLFLAGPVSAADQDPFNGVWANTAYQSSGGKQGQRLTITVRGEEETYLSELFSAQGQRSVLTFVVRYDNMPVPGHSFIVAPDGSISQRVMSVRGRRVDAAHRVIEHMVDGKVVRRLTRSRAGDTLVSELEDFDAQGKVTNTSHLVFNPAPPKP